MIRSMLVGTSGSGLDVIIYNNGIYYRVETIKPYVNYCYYPLYLPPALASEGSEAHSSLKVCALSEITVEPSAERAAAEHISLTGGISAFARYLYAVHFRRCVLILLAMASTMVLALIVKLRRSSAKSKEA
jgi:hypothetical protein